MNHCPKKPRNPQEPKTSCIKITDGNFHSLKNPIHSSLDLQSSLCKFGGYEGGQTPMAAGAATCAAGRDRRPRVGGSVPLLCGPRGLGGIVRPFFVWVD